MAAIIPAKSAISPHVTALRVFVMPTLSDSVQQCCTLWRLNAAFDNP